MKKLDNFLNELKKYFQTDSKVFLFMAQKHILNPKN